MNLNNILSYFDKKKFFFVLRIIIVLLVIVLELNVVSFAYSRYESHKEVNVKPDIALFLTRAGTYSETLSLSGLLPRSESYTYLIYVTNSDKDGNPSNVNIDYKIEFETTTNLPITLDIIDDDTGLSIIDDVYSYTDINGVYYNVYQNNLERSFNYGEVETKYFRVIVNYPASYADNPEYQSMIDLFEVNITAEQRLE